LLIDLKAAGQTAHMHRVTGVCRQRCNSARAGGAIGGLHHRDTAQSLATVHRLRDKQVDVSLQEAAATELQDRLIHLKNLKGKQRTHGQRG
jgi:hypothetical protein